MILLLIIILMIESADCRYDRRIITSLKYSKNKVVPLLIRGENAKIGDVPYLISIKQAIIENMGVFTWANICGGTIITARRVVTAAHCFEEKDFYFIKHPDLLRVVAGILANRLVHSGLSETSAFGQWRYLNQVTIHDDYSFPENDLAIVYIDKPWVFNDKVQPITIVVGNTDNAENCSAAGFGKAKASIYDGSLDLHVVRIARISVLTNNICSHLWDLDMSKFICSATALVDVSEGDSGGPLVCDFFYNSTSKVRALAGVVSGRNYDKTTLYTRVSAYHSWLENVKNAAQRPRIAYVYIIVFIVK